MSEITLPTTPVAVDKVNPVVTIIYGATKVGKTAALAELKNNLIIDLERGSETYETLRVRCDNAEDFNNIIEQLKAGHEYKYVTIDTLDRLVEWFENAVKKEWNEAQKRVKEPVVVKTYSEIPYGKGYDMVRLKMRAFINLMRKTVPHLILVAHLKRTIIGDTSIEVKEDNLDLVGKLRNLVCADADAIAYAFRAKDDDEKPVMKFSFIATDNTAAGSRLPHLRGKKIIVSKLIDPEKDIYETYWDTIFPA